jgi:hypothetical protein
MGFLVRSGRRKTYDATHESTIRFQPAVELRA